MLRTKYMLVFVIIHLQQGSKPKLPTGASKGREEVKRLDQGDNREW